MRHATGRMVDLDNRSSLPILDNWPGKKDNFNNIPTLSVGMLRAIGLWAAEHRS
jgi:hypothetical protein